MFMVNFLQSPNIKEAHTTPTPIIGGASLVQGQSSPDSSQEFQNLLQQSKSEQVSPLDVKKLAAAVHQASDMVTPSPGAEGKHKLSELSGDELLQFLMAQTELTDIDENAPVPEHLASWLESEVSPLEVDDINSEVLGIVIGDTSGLSKITDKPESLAINVTLASGDSAVTSDTPDVLNLDSSSQAAIGGLNETPEESISTELNPEVELEASTEAVNIGIGIDKVANALNEAPGAEQAKAIAAANVANENIKTSVSPLNDAMKIDTKSQSDLLAVLSGLDDNGDLKPISLLATTDEPKSVETLKSQLLPEPPVKVISSDSDAKTMDLLSAATATLKEPDTTPLIVQNSASTLESAKVERTVLDAINGLNTAQKQAKLPDITPALSDRIFTMIKNDIQHGFIRLDPPELGALEVRIQVTQESTQIQIVSQSQQVREALESQSVRLRESLAEQGLNLSSLDVNDQSTGDTSAQSEGGQDNSSEFEDGGQESQNIDSDMPMSASNSLVDHYV
ncbi:MAG: flagellar hook-length control protein FliK [Reinekea sp.]|jgi:flagellar hook-length control protein FliK